MKTKVQVNSKGAAQSRIMLETGLEEAIYRAFPLLLPDLWASGYRIISQQAVLLGRRLDLLLQTDDGRTCIIEAKRGAPAMSQVRDQVLDYADCWAQSYPALAQPRLIVIGNQIPDATRLELANFGVESRTITTRAVSAALQLCQPDRPGSTGLKLIPDDLTKIKHLLAKDGAALVPAVSLLQPPWSHAKTFLALVKRGEKHTDLCKNNAYVQLYPQHPNCAVLYGPGVEAAKHGPLHLNPRVPSWRENVLQSIRLFVRSVHSENKGPGRARNNFDCYAITDWNGFAKSLGL